MHDRMRAIHELNEKVSALTSHTKALEAATGITAIQRLLDNPTMKMIRELENSPVMKMQREMERLQRLLPRY